MEAMVIRICSLLSLLVSSALSAAIEPHSVAFSAGLTNTVHIQDKQTVVYDKVFVNEHDAYDPYTGIFTCPVPGVYIFHFHAYNTNKDSVMWLDLIHNDQLTVSVSGYNSHTVASNTIMLKLRHNDRVQVQSKEHQQFSLFGLSDQIYSTFTGYNVIADANRPYMDSGSTVVG